MEKTKENTCCFTGHRPDKLPWGENELDARAAALKEQIMAAVQAAFRGGKRHFICGMARGCDMYFCEAVAALRFANPSVTLEAAIPFEGQAEHFSEADRKKYFALLRECDSARLVSPSYFAGAYSRRNRYMVDSSSLLIAVWSGAAGGTKQTVDYARRRGVETVVITP